MEEETGWTKGWLRAGPVRAGWITIWVVDEHGCVLNTEPVCTIPVDYHQWFADWLEGQETVLFPALLQHSKSPPPEETEL